MTIESPYRPPTSDVTLATSIEDIQVYRKSLIPKWIKVFGWIFIVVGCLAVLLSTYGAISGIVGDFALYGFKTRGPVFAPAAMFIIGLFIAHGIAAYGLLFAKSWGVLACMILAYFSVLMCLFTMFAGGGANIRLELVVLVLYLIKLHQLRPQWSP